MVHKILFLILLISSSNLGLAAVEFAKPWEYSQTEKPGIAPNSIGPDQVSDWQALKSHKVPEGINQTIWIRNQLPETLAPGVGIYIPNGLEDIAIYIAGEKVYQWGSFEVSWSRVTSQRWHIIPIREEWAGQSIHLRYHYALSMFTQAFLPSIRPVAEAYDQHISTNIITVLMSGAFLTLAMISLILALVRRKLDVFAYFGMLGSASAIWIMFNQEAAFKQYLPLPAKYWVPVDVLFLYLGVASFFSFIKDIARWPQKWAQYFSILPWAVFWLGCLGLVSTLLNPWYIIPGTHLAAVICIFAYLPRTIYLGIKSSGEARIFSIGCLGICTAGVHDILRYVEGFPQLGVALIPFGSLILFGAMALILARRFNEEKQEAIRVRERMIEVIEAQVDEKTRDIRSIMTHIPLGIFALTRDQFKIHKDYSDHLKELFEIDDLTDLNGLDVLFKHCQLSSDEISQARSTIEMSLGEPSFSFEGNMHCLPREIGHERHDGTKRILEITWNPICNALDIVEKILITVRDVTQLRALEEEANDKKEELQFIGELVNVSGETFHRFIQNCNDFISENRKLLNSQSIQRKDMEILKVLFINMHTLKGAARSLYFKKMTRNFHDVEQYYALLQHDPQVQWDIEKMKNDLDEVEEIIRVYENIDREKLGRKKADHRLIEISEKEAFEIYHLVNVLQAAPAQESDRILITEAREIEESLFPHIFKPADRVLSEIFESTERLARDLNKACPSIQVEEPGLFLTTQGENLLQKIFVHMLRNSLDHGIEEPQQRLAANKSENGTITVKFSKQEDTVTVHYADDGQGLKLSKIYNQAIQSKIIAGDSKLSPLETAELIFHAGLSTASSVSDISGRGVGMGAVRRYLEDAGGRISIHLHQVDNQAVPDQVSFHFEIVLPAQLFAKSTHDTGIIAA